MEPFWMSFRETNLRQGDLLPGCWIPEYPADFAEQTDEARIIEADQADLIFITQTCDLEHAQGLADCVVPGLVDYGFRGSANNSGRGKSGKAWRDFWNNVRKGRSPTLHLLASPTTPAVARAALLVDFRAIYSLPVGYLSRHAGQLGDRWRLRSPFLEHFSQALARSFMRVGLPSSVPEF